MDIYILRRYILFAISLFINALGIAFITKALLGTSPITSVNYVLSLFTPLTLGQWTIMLNILFVILELLLITKNELKTDLRIFLLQIPISLCFGTFIDWSMNILYWVNPEKYISQVTYLLIGCFVLATGIALEVKANIAMVSGEYFVRVIARRFRKDFGYVKLGVDVTLMSIACLLSYFFMSGIYGIREGTIVAALAVGPIVHFISPYYRICDKWIKTGKYAETTIPQKTNIIITIAREFGSGGHLLGEMLAKELGIKLYDKELIRLIAQKNGINERNITNNEQAIPHFKLKNIFPEKQKSSLKYPLSPENILFVAENKIIQEITEKESCIIVGRCADFLLKDHPKTIKIFCYSNFENAYNRCVDKYNIPKTEAESEIKKINQARVTHYEYYTGRKWKDPHHYDLMVNTGKIKLTQINNLVKEIYRNLQKNNNGLAVNKSVKNIQKPLPSLSRYFIRKLLTHRNKQQNDTT